MLTVLFSLNVQINFVPIQTHSPKNNETFYPPEIAKAFALISFSALSMLAVAPAQAVVIDFESLAVNDRKFHFLPSYTEDGFTITNDAVSRYGINTPDQLLAYWGTQFSGFAGSTALFNNTAATTTNLAQVGGGAFSLSSIDLADLFDAGDPTTINFTGNIAGGGTVSQSFTTDSLKGLETFTFSNFTNLASVDWTVASYMQFDNINVSAAGTTAVPEPFTVLGTIFGAGYGVALKRKLAKAKQAKEDIS